MTQYAFIDTHCHFDFPPFLGDEVASLARAQQQGVEQIIVPSVNAAGFEPVLALARQHGAVHAALGLHPIEIAVHQDQHLEQLEQLLQLNMPELVAIGEIGLDGFMDQAHTERQEAILLAQLALARRYHLPVILHSRRTHDRLVSLLRRHPVTDSGVLHGFAGSYQQALAFIDQGLYIGVGGTITYPRASKTRQVMARLPLDRLVLETDAPDMPVAGFQGQPNRPERIYHSFNSLCELRPEPAAEIAATLRANSLRLFRRLGQ